MAEDLFGKALRADLDRFYQLIASLIKRQGLMCFRDCAGKWTCPEKGVYFLFEEGEMRAGSSVLRVTRVGTHTGAKSTLRQRLRHHRGKLDGTGNYRSSVFRRHVGSALMHRQSMAQGPPLSWGNELERLVSKYIGDVLFVCLEVPDGAGKAENRTSIEKNSIALLSGAHGKIDPARKDWLGKFSPSEKSKIIESGLWNVNHVFSEYDRDFLSLMEHCVNAGGKSIS